MAGYGRESVMVGLIVLALILVSRLLDNIGGWWGHLLGLLSRTVSIAVDLVLIGATVAGTLWLGGVL